MIIHSGWSLAWILKKERVNSPLTWHIIFCFPESLVVWFQLIQWILRQHKNSADPDQMALLEASWSESTLFSKGEIFRCCRIRVNLPISEMCSCLWWNCLHRHNALSMQFLYAYRRHSHIYNSKWWPPDMPKSVYVMKCAKLITVWQLLYPPLWVYMVLHHFWHNIFLYGVTPYTRWYSRMFTSKSWYKTQRHVRGWTGVSWRCFYVYRQ